MLEGRTWWCVVLCLALVVVALVVIPPTRAAAAACDAPVVNEVACENTKTGSPAAEWDVSGIGSDSIQGFATDISVNRGSTVRFKVDTSASSFAMTIYRMGYYGGMGARSVASLTFANPGGAQPSCRSDSATGLVDCGNWTENASWAVPSDAVSGVYFAKVKAGGEASHIMFIVRNDASRSDLFFQTSDTTWQAYNTYGGNSLYVGSPADRAYKVSYNRPFYTRASDTEHDWVFNAEYPAIRFLEANGYDVSYTTGVDSDRSGALIKNHKTFLSVGHDEYWSGTQRANVEAARDAGVNLAFFSGNEVFWKTRWENGSGGTPYRTLVSYKETHANAKIDPIGSGTWTGTWRDPRFSPPADGGRPENALTGTLFKTNCCTTDMTVNGVDGQMRFWRGTKAASLSPSQSTTLGAGILGYEWDESPDNGFRPAGAISLSTTTRSGVETLQDYGSSFAAGSATHHLTMYRAASGALVFGAGTVQWAWGLDDNHATRGGTKDAAVQQATVNLFADMGAQPTTLQSGLVRASASTDTSPPTSTITSPAAGAAVPARSSVTVSGTAADSGGAVGGVEVSVDNGSTWHPAAGRASWSYTFTTGSDATLTIKTRATDDSLRTETPGAGRTITVGAGGGGGGGACPCSLFSPTATPAVAADPDTSANELGVKFASSQAGTVTGLRFYKAASNTGTHVGTLWSASGTKLASATFSESASGWQQVSFATPVAITKDTTYVASYFAPNGHYSTTDGYFSSALSSAPLSSPADLAGSPNGVFKAGAAGFPTQGYAASNYWVDVVFSPGTTGPDTIKPSVTAKSPADGATSVSVQTSAAATFSEPVVASSTTMSLRSGSTNVAGTVTYDASGQRATFTPASALDASTTYTVSVSGAKDTAGNVMDPVSWAFSTAAAAPSDTTAPTVTGTTPAAGAGSVAVSTTIAATFSEALQPGTVSVAVSSAGGNVAGTLAYDTASQRATFTPGASLAAGTTYTATVSGARDAAGNTMTPVTWTFTTAAASSSGCPCTIWAPGATPGTAADPETKAIEVGVKFRAIQSGKVTAIRFYKGAANTSSHTGSIWSSTGTRLGTVTFTGESSSGWQEATFATPVNVVAGTTYVASYFTKGRYSLDEGYFSGAVARGPLTALADGADGGNGVYTYASKSTFPKSTYKASNYWVDVVFATS